MPSERILGLWIAAAWDQPEHASRVDTERPVCEVRRHAAVPALMVEPLDSTPPSADADPVFAHDRANLVYQASAIIARPLEEVFAFADKPENEHLWQASTLEVEQTSAGASGVGATGHAKGRMLGNEGEATWEVTEHIPNRKVATTISWEGHHFYGVWLFDRVPEGTWVRMIYHMPDGPQGLLGKVPDRTVVRIFHIQLQGTLRNLKNLLEA